MKTKKIFYLIPAFFFILFMILTICLAIIPDEKVGLMKINTLFKPGTYHHLLDTISDIFLIISLLFMVAMAGLGLYQLIRRKGIKKVNVDILLFGAIIVFMIVVWLFFIIVPINTRPYSDESSYPSTHIMVVTTTYFTMVWMLIKRTPKKWLKIFGYIVAICAIISVYILRMASGMHWFTDCMGGLLIGLTLAFLLIALDVYLKNKVKK